jgi:branched-chain amino acid transport system permease protein
MDAMGYNVWLYKYIAFVVAALFAGLAGGLYAYENRFVSTSVLGVIPAAEAFLMVVLGGTGTLFGPAVGAAIIVLLRNFISGYTDRWMLILGLIYIFVVVVAPNGVLAPFRRRLMKGALTRGSTDAADRPESVEELRRSPGYPAREPDR